MNNTRRGVKGVASPLFAKEATSGLPDGGVVDFQGFKIGVPAMLIDIKQELLDVIRLSAILPLDSGIASVLPAAAKAPPLADGFLDFGRELSCLLYTSRCV